MSYDMDIVNENHETVQLPERHSIAGGTYCIGGTRELTLNITGNYWKIFQRLFGEKGTDIFNGMEISESLPILAKAIEELGDAEPDGNYWTPCDGNVKRCLMKLEALASLALIYFPKNKMFWEKKG